MPNGGIPIHMVLKPRSSKDTVVYCHGAEVKVFAAENWENSHASADPVLTLNRDEALVLERFLKYWLEGEVAGEGVLYRREGVDVEFDF